MKIETLKPLLETYAYNILGSYEDARDAVQDVWLKLLEKPIEGVENSRAYLVKSVVNHSINIKNRQKKFLKTYPGSWLPEPVGTEDPDMPVEHEDILSFSLMVLLERLSPKERAVFILKEGYHYSHREIAETLDISEENSRQLFRRGRDKLGRGNIPGIKSTARQEKLTRLAAAIQSGEMEQLENLLHDDIVITSDGGGKATAARNPVVGVDHTTRFLTGVYEKFYKKSLDMRMVVTSVNHQPALFYYLGDTVINCMLFTEKEGRIDHIFFVRNPDKLKNLQKRI